MQRYNDLLTTNTLLFSLFQISLMSAGTAEPDPSWRRMP